MQAQTIHGIHHITAIAGDPQRNLDFYSSVLGLRLVKLTVHFDDPGDVYPLDQNEPGISSAFRVLASLIDSLSVQGVDTSRVGLLGFSQGACLALEFAARHATRYAGLFALSGGLIGPQGTPRNYSGSFEGTPLFLGCSDVDPHVPHERVHESADVFTRLNATVDERIYPRMGHTVNEDEIAAIQRVIT
jgi:predicted esterase